MKKDIDKISDILFLLVAEGVSIYLTIGMFDLLFIHTSLLSSCPPSTTLLIGLVFAVFLIGISLIGIILYHMINGDI